MKNCAKSTSKTYRLVPLPKQTSLALDTSRVSPSWSPRGPFSFFSSARTFAWLLPPNPTGGADPPLMRNARLTSDCGKAYV